MARLLSINSILTDANLARALRAPRCFGPYLGEFGWEALYWQGWLRQNAKPGDAVICRRGREWFYADWCDNIIPVDYEYLVDRHGPICDRFIGADSAPTIYRAPTVHQTFIAPRRDDFPDRICILYRWRPERNHEKDRTREEYAPVLEWAGERGLAVDWLDCATGVEQSVRSLSSSVFAIGPEGGGVKLAILTGTPLLTWGLRREEARLRDENIFGSKILYFPRQETRPADVIIHFSSLLCPEYTPPA